MTPTKPRFSEHRMYLDILRRRSVYRPGVPGEEVQRHIQRIIERMREDGYSPEVIRALLTLCAESALAEAERHNCNVHRARFFHNLVYLELESL